MRNVRINLEVPEEVREQIKRLVAKSKASSMTEATRRAFNLAELIHDHTAAGGAVILRSEKGEEERVRFL